MKSNKKAWRSFFVNSSDNSFSEGLSRRKFLNRFIAAAGVLAAPVIIPATAIGRNGRVPPSERIIMGGIGIGGRGTADLNWMLPEPDVQFVAVCDAKKSARE
ncbi:MAG: hypothetical protein ACP5K7_14115, partial [Verrucomicrobiia bacterium]